MKYLIIAAFVLVLQIVSSTSIYSQVLADSSLTLTRASNTYSVVHPDGQSIIFSSDRDGDLDLYRMNTDGSGVQKIFDLPGNEGHPDISPDGKLITFYGTVGKVEEDLYEIYVANIDGSNLRRLTDYENYVFHPKFTPDGSKILYNRQVPSGEDKYEFYEVDLESGEHELILSDENNITFGSYSPNGEKIAFVKWLGLPEIFIYDVETKEQINVSDHELFDGWPTWSPDGSKVAFASDREQQRKFDLYVYDVESRELMKVTEGEGSHMQPAWFPKGDRIVNTHSLNRNNNLVIQYISDK